jgi:hypothetical protein
MPPSDKIETLTPVFPKGRVGTNDDLPVLLAKPAMGAIMDPRPATPVVFKKFLRDNCISFFRIFYMLLKNFSFHNIRIKTILLLPSV